MTKIPKLASIRKGIFSNQDGLWRFHPQGNTAATSLVLKFPHWKEILEMVIFYLIPHVIPSSHINQQLSHDVTELLT